MKRLLIVDDEINMQKVLQMLFKREHYEVVTASNGKEAFDLVKKARNPFNLIVSDLKMSELDGIGLLKKLKESGMDIPLILITAYGSISEAVEAMKLGAADFITKPFNKDDLKSIVRRVLHEEPIAEKDSVHLFRDDEGVIYNSDEMRKIMESVRKIAPSNLSIMLTGESGTGKGIIAKAIHNYAFPESDSPFVAINCPAVPETLLESELFGYRRGAFTGADKDFPGKVSMADGGTLFLDEIGDLSLSIQAKLLKLLEEGVYEPLGSTVEKKAHIRIVSATNQDIPEMIEQRRFREDLFYRINSVILEIPPLRIRKKDIYPLTRYFLEKFSRENGKNIAAVSEEGIAILQGYNWPGNIRELRNVIHHAVIISDGPVINAEDLHIPKEEKKNKTLPRAEKKIIEETLNRNGGNISAAARDLGISRGALRNKIKKYSILG